MDVLTEESNNTSENLKTIEYLKSCDFSINVFDDNIGITFSFLKNLLNFDNKDKMESPISITLFLNKSKDDVLTKIFSGNSSDFLNDITTPKILTDLIILNHYINNENDFNGYKDTADFKALNTDTNLPFDTNNNKIISFFKFWKNLNDKKPEINGENTEIFVKPKITEIINNMNEIENVDIIIQKLNEISQIVSVTSVTSVTSGGSTKPRTQTNSRKRTNSRKQNHSLKKLI
jgi:hypothetical protein